MLCNRYLNFYLGGVSTGCGNIFFTGGSDIITASSAEEIAISATGVQAVNRTPSAFWPYQS